MQREPLRLLSLLRSAARTLQERTSAADGSLQQQLQRCFHSNARGSAAHKPALDQGPLLLLQGRHIFPRMEVQQARQRLGSLLLPCRAAASASRPSLAAAVSNGSKVNMMLTCTQTLHMLAALEASSHMQKQQQYLAAAQRPLCHGGHAVSCCCCHCCTTLIPTHPPQTSVPLFSLTRLQNMPAANALGVQLTSLWQRNRMGVYAVLGLAAVYLLW